MLLGAGKPRAAHQCDWGGGVVHHDKSASALPESVTFVRREAPLGGRPVRVRQRNDLRSLSKVTAQSIRRRVEKVLALDRAEDRLVARISVIGTYPRLARDESRTRRIVEADLHGLQNGRSGAYRKRDKRAADREITYPTSLDRNGHYDAIVRVESRSAISCEHADHFMADAGPATSKHDYASRVTRLRRAASFTTALRTAPLWALSFPPRRRSFGQ